MSADCEFHPLIKGDPPPSERELVAVTQRIKEHGYEPIVLYQGKPVADARVTLQDTEGGHLKTTETNSQGHFWFPSLPEGQYSVRASDQGRVSEWRQGVWVSPGQQTDVTLHLHSHR